MMKNRQIPALRNSFKAILYLSVIILPGIHIACISDGPGIWDNRKEQVPNPASPEAINPPPTLSSPDYLPNWIWEALPEEDGLVLIASSPRYSKKELEENTLLQLAARQVGIFEDFWGANQDILVEKGYTTQTAKRTRAQYNAAAEDAALPNLKTLEIWRNNDGAWGKFKIERPGLPALSWEPEYAEGKPTWMMSPPKIPGWIVAVANGRKQSTIARSLQKSDEEALAEIIKQVHGSRLSVDQYRVQSTKNSSQASVSMQSEGKGFGLVRGFLVIARWYDGGNAWSLAVCPEDWNG